MKCDHRRWCWTGMNWILLAVLGILLVLLVSDASAVTQDVASVTGCQGSGVNATGAVAGHCPKRRRKFMRRYLKHLERSKNRRFHVCKQTSKLAKCLSPEPCPQEPPDVPHWRKLLAFLNCSCAEEKGGCHASRMCVEREYIQPLMHRCDDLYWFNIQQYTQDKCFFLRESMRCRDAIMTSACGEEGAEFALHLAAAEHHKMLHSGCQLSRGHFANDFGYSEQCPLRFTKDLLACEERHSQKDRLLFFDVYNIVAVGNRRDTKVSCRAFQHYTRCVRDTVDSCPYGAQLLYEFDNRLRTYNSRMEYICNEVKDVYVENLYCYQRVFHNVSLLSCHLAWDEALRALSGISAYQFFCHRDSTNTSRLARVLKDVLRCYENAFTSGCGSAGGAVVVEVIKRAFNDPYYLRLKYKPDCALHAGKEDRKPVTRTIYRNSGNSRPSGETITTMSGARWRGGSGDVSLIVLAVLFVQLSMRSRV